MTLDLVDNDQHSHPVGEENLPFTRRGRKLEVSKQKTRACEETEAAEEGSEDQNDMENPASPGTGEVGAPLTQVSQQVPIRAIESNNGGNSQTLATPSLQPRPIPSQPSQSVHQQVGIQGSSLGQYIGHPQGGGFQISGSSAEHRNQQGHVHHDRLMNREGSRVPGGSGMQRVTAGGTGVSVTGNENSVRSEEGRGVEGQSRNRKTPSQEVWDRLGILFESIRSNAQGGYEYPGTSVVALETVLIRLYVEGPMSGNSNSVGGG